MNWLFGPVEPRCGYCYEYDTELIFKHKGGLTCGVCLASWEGLEYNHATKRFRKVKV
jgi:hypothetical protein